MVSFKGYIIAKLNDTKCEIIFESFNSKMVKKKRLGYGGASACRIHRIRAIKRHILSEEIFNNIDKYFNTKNNEVCFI